MVHRKIYSFNMQKFMQALIRNLLQGDRLLEQRYILFLWNIPKYLVRISVYKVYQCSPYFQYVFVKELEYRDLILLTLVLYQDFETLPPFACHIRARYVFEILLVRRSDTMRGCFYSCGKAKLLQFQVWSLSYLFVRVYTNSNYFAFSVSVISISNPYLSYHSHE